MITKSFVIYFKVFKRLGFILIWILCILVIVEITLRILGYFYANKPALNKISDDKILTILCFGDSFTYGWGVDSKDSYPKQLEKMLNNSNLNRNRSFRVFNLGVPGSNSSQHLKYFAQVLSKYQKPDLAIFLTGTNDSWNFADSNILRFIDKKDTFNLFRIKLKLFFSQLRTYKMVKIIILNLKGRPPESDIDPFKLIRKYEDIPEKTLSKLIEYNLIEIIDLARSNNTKLIFQNYPRCDVQGTLVQDVAKHFGIPFVDNFSAFNEQLKKVRFKDLFLYDISHPNPGGYTLMAKGIYKVIREEVLTNK